MDEKPFDSMNVIPFVDIMLVLLTIVLTTSSFIATGRIPVHLPQASKSITDTDKIVTIELTVNGSVYLEGKVVTLNDLRSTLSPLKHETSFLIRADRDLSLQRFIDVTDVLKQMGFSRVAVQTKDRT
jgi:biopolymer transport protein ExbD